MRPKVWRLAGTLLLVCASRCATIAPGPPSSWTERTFLDTSSGSEIRYLLYLPAIRRP